MGKVLSKLASHRPGQFLSFSQSLTSASLVSTQDSNPVEEALNISGPGWSAESAAFKFYVECYAWMDILATAITGTRPPQSHRFNYVRFIREGKLQLRNLMGCHDWVMVNIKEISDLRDWGRRVPPERRDNRTMGRFKCRSTQLKKRPEDGLINLLKRRLPLTDGLKRDRDIVTEIYIHAAIVYLHVAVSGPQMNCPKLRE
jgi:C6 transcription factor Pro1